MALVVRVLYDRGLPIRRQGWYHYMLYDWHITFRAPTGPRGPAWRCVVGEGQYTVMAGRAFYRRKQPCTLIVLWILGRANPWVLLTDEAPEDAVLGAYGIRAWIEQGFCAL